MGLFTEYLVFWSCPLPPQPASPVLETYNIVLVLCTTNLTTPSTSEARVMGVFIHPTTLIHSYKFLSGVLQDMCFNVFIFQQFSLQRYKFYANSRFLVGKQILTITAVKCRYFRSEWWQKILTGQKDRELAETVHPFLYVSHCHLPYILSASFYHGLSSSRHVC